MTNWFRRAIAVVVLVAAALAVSQAALASHQLCARVWSTATGSTTACVPLGP